MSRCLILNSDWSYMNLSTSFKALVLAFEGKADVLKAYDKTYRSQYLEIPIPAIIALRKYKDISKRRRNFSASTKNILIRDNFTCCFCGEKLSFKNGTKDHIHASSRGGKTVMSNLVASCKKCNSLKDNRSVEESGFKMLFQPRELTNEERLKCIVKTCTSRERNAWIDWLKENNITLW